MSHYNTRIANGSAFYQPKKRSEQPPEDNGVAYDPMKSLNGARNLRARSGIRGNNAPRR
ncbi:hypothetical protein O3W44_22575 [Pantoea sp. LMR881]|uniref:hypothetical protein n=1 Tax=Pantoea sp. LMR881 TaxID=3014336 RepID=UPI0022AEB1B3|nr:hypothetical protein [Pantoea sp. LMR881]MCZ4061208.1 hypothetical protein [Pantoea sp. LMR881]MCZ4061320.1 hypothetical protein [Pantoea sp. LMR881]